MGSFANPKWLANSSRRTGIIQTRLSRLRVALNCNIRIGLFNRVASASAVSSSAEAAVGRNVGRDCLPRGVQLYGLCTARRPWIRERKAMGRGRWHGVAGSQLCECSADWRRWFLTTTKRTAWRLAVILECQFQNGRSVRCLFHRLRKRSQSQTKSYPPLISAKFATHGDRRRQAAIL